MTGCNPGICALYHYHALPFHVGSNHFHGQMLGYIRYSYRFFHYDGLPSHVGLHYFHTQILNSSLNTCEFCHYYEFPQRGVPTHLSYETSFHIAHTDKIHSSASPLYDGLNVGFEHRISHTLGM